MRGLLHLVQYLRVFLFAIKLGALSTICDPESDNSFQHLLEDHPWKKIIVFESRLPLLWVSFQRVTWWSDPGHSLFSFREQAWRVSFTLQYSATVFIPVFYRIPLPDDRTDSYLNVIKKNYDDDLQMVVAILPTNRKDRYDAIKKLCCLEKPGIEYTNRVW